MFSAVTDCPKCPTNCSYDGKLENACKCLSAKPDPISKHNNSENNNGVNGCFAGQQGVFSTLHFGNLPLLESNELKLYLQTQVSYILNSIESTFSCILIDNNLLYCFCICQQYGFNYYR